MPVFKAFFKILEAKKGIILIYIMVNLVFMLVIAGQGQKTGETMFADTGLDVAVYDRSESRLSREAVSILREKNHVDVFQEKDLEGAGSTEKDKLRFLNNDVRGGIYDYALIILENFDEDGRYRYIASGENSAGYIISGQLDSFLTCVRVNETLGMDEDAAIKSAADTMEKADDADIRMTEEAGNNGHTHGRLYYSFLYMCYSLMMAIVIGISLMLAGMNNEDLTARISCSSLSVKQLGVSRFMASVVYSGVVMVIFTVMALAYGAEDPDMAKAGFFVLNLIPVVVMSAAFAYFLSALTRDESIINMVSNMTSLGMCFISGVFVTQSMMSEKVLRVAQFTPFYWYVRGVDVIEGTGAGQMPGNLFTECFVIQLLFAAALFAAGTVAASAKK